MIDPSVRNEIPVGYVEDRQRISVIMANFNGEAYIARAIRSVLEQTHTDLELIVSDDGSSDKSCEIVRATMAQDHRVRLIEAKTAACGPATARNRALNLATGDWVAIVDSDDIIHPERLSRLLHCALTLRSDLVADDLIHFGQGALRNNRTLLQDLRLSQPMTIDATALVSGNLGGCRNIPLGYLKPLIRRATLGNTRYNEALRIDEDHDLYLRLLLENAGFTLIPDAMHLYRRHAGSVSHRFDKASLHKMIAAQQSLLGALGPEKATLGQAIKKRMQDHELQQQYICIVSALKTRNTVFAAKQVLRNPRCVPLLVQSLIERGQRQKVKQGIARQRKKISLCVAGASQQVGNPDYTIIHVPDAPGFYPAPSAAPVWAELAALACEHDLDIVAYGRPGQYALGLVPYFRTAQIFSVQGEKLTKRTDEDIVANKNSLEILAEEA